MNKKALEGSITFLIIMIFSVMLWIYMINPILQAFIPTMIVTNNITGLEAFLWQNINLFFFVTLALITVSFAIFKRTRRPY